MSGNRNQGAKWISRATRWQIYERDEFRCVWCGRTCVRHSELEDRGALLTLDHVIARADGGTNHPQNLVTACAKCNRMRQGRTVEDFAVTLGPVLAIYARVIYAMTTPLPKRQRKCKSELSTIESVA